MKSDSLEWSEWFSDQLLHHAVQSVQSRLGSKDSPLVCEIVRITYDEYLRQENLKYQFEKQERKNKKKEEEIFSFYITKKNPALSFEQYGIPLGATLVWGDNPHITCTVVSQKGKCKIEFNGEITSLSAAACKIRNTKSEQGPKYWFYNGKSLLEIGNEVREDI